MTDLDASERAVQTYESSNANAPARTEALTFTHQAYTEPSE